MNNVLSFQRDVSQPQDLLAMIDAQRLMRQDGYAQDQNDARKYNVALLEIGENLVKRLYPTLAQVPGNIHARQEMLAELTGIPDTGQQMETELQELDDFRENYSFYLSRTRVLKAPYVFLHGAGGLYTAQILYTFCNIPDQGPLQSLGRIAGSFAGAFYAMNKVTANAMMNPPRNIPAIEEVICAKQCEALLLERLREYRDTEAGFNLVTAGARARDFLDQDDTCQKQAENFVEKLLYRKIIRENCAP